MTQLLIKIFFFISSKYKHYKVVLSHWFWSTHYRGALCLWTYKISDAPLTLVIDFNSKISIATNVNFAGTSKLLAQQGGEIRIKKDCFFNTNCSINALKHITIGAKTIFGEGVKIYDHDHKTEDKTQPYKNQGYVSAAVTIGSNVWIGSNVVILKGVHIGDNAIVAAGSIVKGSVPSNQLWAGVPAKKIKAL